MMPLRSHRAALTPRPTGIPTAVLLLMLLTLLTWHRLRCNWAPFAAVHTGIHDAPASVGARRRSKIPVSPMGAQHRGGDSHRR